MNNKNICLCLDKDKNPHVLYVNRKNGTNTLQYMYKKEQKWVRAGPIYKSKYDLQLSSNGLVSNSELVTVFIEKHVHGTKLHILTKSIEEWHCKMFQLDTEAVWCGLIVGEDVSDNRYVFVIMKNSKLGCYPIGGYSELISEGYFTSDMGLDSASDVSLSDCGDYVGITYRVGHKIRFNFFDLKAKKWLFGNMHTLIQSAPVGKPLGIIVNVDSCGYFHDGLGHICVVWLTKDEFGIYVLRGTIVNTMGNERPLNSRDHVITTDFSDISKVENLSVSNRNMVPCILMLGSKGYWIRFVEDGNRDIKRIVIKDWIGYVKNRKITTCLENNILHVLFSDDSGIYYFPYEEHHLQKLSE